MKSTILIAFFSAMLACHPQKSELVNVDEISFETSDASEIFFRNVRQSNYQKEEMKAAGIDLYSYKKWNDSTFTVSLIHNWRTDMAYLQLAATNETLKTDISDLNFWDQTKYALQVFNQIQKNGSRDSVLTSFDRESFRVVVFDFLRLVDER